jgi:Dynein light intermediate chain (DLIC)
LTSYTPGLPGLSTGSKGTVRASSKSFVKNTASAVCLILLVLPSCPGADQLPHVGQAHLQHYAEPSAEPLPATSSTLQSTILPLGPGTFTHNVAGVPIVVACTKADLIDDTNDLVGAGSSGMGGMVKGKGDEWEERTDAIMQILRTVCLKCMS